METFSSNAHLVPFVVPQKYGASLLYSSLPCREIDRLSKGHPHRYVWVNILRNLLLAAVARTLSNRNDFFSNNNNGHRTERMRNEIRDGRLEETMRILEGLMFVESRI